MTTLNKANKSFLMFIMVPVFVQFSYGQKTEINFNAYSGFFTFHGKGATSNSAINAIYLNTDNPYGKKNKFSYAIELQGQRLSKRKNIYGLGIDYEVLTSKVNINYLGEKISDSYYPNLYSYFPATGQTNLKNMFITLNPFIGHRFLFRKINFDLLAGFDAAFCMESKESGNATINHITFLTTQTYCTVKNDKPKPSIDFRPRIQIKIKINKWGFLVGYSLGLTNYQTAGNYKAYTNFLRLGLGYQLK